MATVGILLPWVEASFRTLDTDMPNVGGYVEFFENGAPSTHKATYSQADLDPVSVQSNPVHLDANGRAIIFLAPGLYDVSVFDTDMELLYTVEGVGEPDAASGDGPVFVWPTSGARHVVSGYTVLPADFLVTVSEPVTDPAVINLPAIAEHPSPIVIKNLGPTKANIVPFGTETIDGSLTHWMMGSPAAPVFQTIILAPDQVTGTTWMILSGLDPAAAS